MNNDGIDFKVNALAFNTLFDNRLKRFIDFYGGAGSSKSWSIAQWLVLEKFQKEEHIGILCVRKTRPAVKNSCWKIIKHWVKVLGCKVDENKTDLVITDKARNNFIQFIGCDDVEKVKSIEGINYVWIEETTELRRKDYMQLNLRARASNINSVKDKNGEYLLDKKNRKIPCINQLFITFNPVDPVKNKWLKRRTDLGSTSKRCIFKINHDENPFLSAEEHEQIENLINEDAEYDKIYRLGQWATPTAIIYSNWDIVKEWPNDIDSKYGLDFGFINPSALVEVKFTEDMTECWVRENLYKSKLTDPMLVRELAVIIENKSQLIIADSADPRSITQIRNAGFNCQPAIKGKDSVFFGIKSVQSIKVHIYYESTNLIEEFQTYKWKVNKDEEVMEGEPVKLKDHLVDALRYIVSRVKGYTKVDLVISDPDKIKDEQEEIDYDKMNKELTEAEKAEQTRQEELVLSEDDGNAWSSF